MRKKIIAGNWKMNLDKIQVSLLVEQLLENESTFNLSEEKIMVLAPSYVYLEYVVEKTKSNQHIKIAAQDCSEHHFGAYTGEVASSMLQSIGIEYTIVGHSERRIYHQESDNALLNKLQQCIKNNIKPIFCCGESLEIRENNTHLDFIQKQLNDVVFLIDAKDFRNITIAYEPIWAIGTGKTASVEQAQEMHAYIRKLIEQKYSEDIAMQTTILYGGSVNAQNALSLFQCSDIDGALVGGASLKSEDFATIAKAL